MQNVRMHVRIRTGGTTLRATHGYISSYEAYQAPAIEAAGALGEFQSGRSWRMLLLGGAAAGTLSFGISRESHAGPDPCSPLVGGARTCTGNQSAGIAYSGASGVTTLNVNTLNQNIAPAANTGGIIFFSGGAATLNSDTTPFNITTSGTGRGIDVGVAGANAAIVTHTGDITATSTGDGVKVFSNSGIVTVNTTGTITTVSGIGITARSYSAGAVMVTHTGDTISSNRSGIVANSRDGSATVMATGNITSGDQGINASAVGTNVTHVGNVHAVNRGISAASNTGAATINSTGNVTSTTGRGLNAFANSGAVSVTHSGGDITASTQGIQATTSGGGVTVNNTGNITVTGGQGVYARDFVSGAVNVTQTGGAITALQHGIYARSNSGAVTVNVTQSGVITAGNVGIQVRNVAGNAAMTIGGTVTGNTGVRIISSAGTTNTLTILAGGNVTAASTAVSMGAGDDTLDNSGTITGTVALGGGTNAFNNLAGSTFNSGTIARVEAGNTLTNSGTLSPGGTGTIQTTALTGNLTQTAGGTTAVDVNMAAMTNDQVTVTGTANLAGTVTLNLLTVTGDTKTITVQTSTGGNTDSGLTLAPLPPAVSGVLAVNANNVEVTFNVNFLGAGGPGGTTLTPNQTATATTLNSILAGGAPGAQGLLTALANLPTGAFGDALDQLSPEVLGNLSFSTLLASLGFTDNALSCKQAAGMYAVVKEAECVWVRPGARRFSQDRQDDGSNPGSTETAFGLSAGAQAALDVDKTWIVGLSAGYEHVDQEGNEGRSIITGDGFNGSAVIKYAPGPVLLAAGITGGYGTFDSARTISFTGFSGVAEGDFNSVFVNGRLRAAYLFEGPANNGQGQQADWYVKPQMDVDFIWSRRGGFTETGATGANLAVESESQFNVVFSPSVEFGAELGIGTAAARPFLKVGAQIFSNTENDVTASFAAAPGSPNFTTTSKTDRVFGTVSTGVDVVHEKALSLKLQYDGKFSGNSRSHAIGAKFSWRF